MRVKKGSPLFLGEKDRRRVILLFPSFPQGHPAWQGLLLESRI